MSNKPDKSTEKGWKRHLLSSGIPLEYEVAEHLGEQGMVTEADFSFTRPNGNETTEGSVDILCRSYEKFGKSEVAFKINLLIECKYRSPNKTLLLLPIHHEYAVTAGYSIQGIDALSKFHIRSTAFSEFEQEIPFVYKGIEIYEGGAIEKEFRHGIEQLRYAAPVMIRNEIDNQLGLHIDDVTPIFFAKIIVTNAPIRILKSGIGLSEMEKSSVISDISSPVGFAVMYSEYGSDYEEYVRSVFSTNQDRRAAAAENHADSLEFAGKALSKYSDPVRLVREMTLGGGHFCRKLATQFFVCDLNNLPDLIRTLRSTCRNAYRGRTKTDVFLKSIRKGMGSSSWRREFEVGQG